MIIRPTLGLLAAGCLVVSLAGCARPRATVLDVTLEGGTVESPAVVAADPPFELPRDATGPLLAKTLPPADARGLLPDPAHVRLPFPPPQFSASPYPSTLPGGATARVAPAPFTPTQRTLLPRLVADEATFSTSEDVALPQVVRFPTPDRDRVASEDAARPVLPPVLATPTPDRVALEDPTAESSAAAAVAAPLPLRTTPAPFFKLTLPDPYEFRRAVKLNMPPVEDPTPATATPRLPR